MASSETVIPAGPNYHVWWFPGSPVKVHLALDVVQRLGQRLHAAGVGASAEGLLFGTFRDGITEILDFCPAAKDSLSSMVAAAPTEDWPSLVGYYRTEDGDTFRLTAQDFSLAGEYFTKPYHVFLMIRSSGSEAPNATFFFRGADGQPVDFAFLEFPFDSSLLAIEDHDQIESPGEMAGEQVAAMPAAAPAPPAAESPRKKHGSLRKAALWTCAVAVVFALGMLFRNDSFREQCSHIWRAILNRTSTASSSPAAAQPSSHRSMALRAARQNGDLQLTWNPESALITEATSGVISIQDGETKRSVPLDAAQLRGGSLLYSATSDQVLMQLTVTTPAETVTEAVTAILPKAGKAQTAPPQVREISSGSVAAPPPPSTSSPTVTTSRPFTRPSLAKEAPSPALPVLQEPPASGINPAAPAALSNVTPRALSPPPPTPARASEPSAPVVATFEPPVAIVKITPAVPPELRSLIIKQTVQVKVTIDETGKVVKADAVPQQNVSQLLLNSAVRAARAWRFQPARRNHQPVSCEWILQFVFSR